ncbi:MAG: hypothetical protein RH951_12425 [Parvibaculum sp.]
MTLEDLVWGLNGDSYLTGRRIKALGELYVRDRAATWRGRDVRLSRRLRAAHGRLLFGV